MSGHQPGAGFEILLVEDNAGDIRLAREALRENNSSIRIEVAPDGAEALAFLLHEGTHAHAPRPDLILLDLNLPKKDGREVLAEIKADEHLRQTPVIVLTTSQADEDILRAYDLHGNCYVKKPLTWGEFARVVKLVEDFWLTTVTLPLNGTR